ncbi:MAG: hypothetical protein KA186_12670, partial [Flavobacteriales bacterium]|nr:hypothetical protein [Flavobacteriales bacterium]
MMARIFLFMAVAWSGVAQAQPTFEKIYLATGAYKRNLIELPSGNVIAGIAWGPGITTLNPSGDFQHSKCFWSDSVLT